MKIIFIFPCSGMFRNVPCSGFYRRPSCIQQLEVSCLHEMQPSLTVWNYWSLQPKNDHVKELNRHFLQWKSFIGMFSFPASKTPGARDCSHQSKLLLNPAHLMFWVLGFSDNKKIIKRTKILFPGFSVDDNDDVFILVSFISIVILFLVIAFSQIILCEFFFSIVFICCVISFNAW